MEFIITQNIYNAPQIIDNTTVKERLTLTLSYLEFGFALMPIVPKGKEPYAALLPKNNNGKPSWALLREKKATTDDIQRWFTIDPDVNIAVITGQASDGLVVVDFDKSPPYNFHIPICPQVLTGKKEGFHLYFRTNQPIRSGVFTFGDIKAESGYVLIPPSIHPNGKPYKWGESLSPNDVEFIEPPVHLLPLHKQLPITKAKVESNITITHSYPQDGRPIRSASSAYTLLADPVTPDLLRALDKDEKSVLAMSKVLGLSEHTQIGRAFRCILPGHEEKKPSAALYQANNGQIIYRDLHNKCKPALMLAEVYASIAYGEVKELKKPELITWHISLAIKAGLLKPANVEAAILPSSIRPLARRLYKGFIDLLRCKWLYDAGQPTTFTWRFAAAWCGVSQRNIGDAMKELLRRGYIIKVGEHKTIYGKEMALFLPGQVR